MKYVSEKDDKVQLAMLSREARPNLTLPKWQFTKEGEQKCRHPISPAPLQRGDGPQLSPER